MSDTEVSDAELSDTEEWRKHGWIEHSQLLLDSYRKWLGVELITRVGSPEAEARALFESPFVVVSHGTQADPILNYGNQVALDLWEVDVATLIKTPSRETAQPMHRDERARLLERTARDGYVDDYQGVRISSTGKRFHIARAIVWNLVDANGNLAGQAATFADWEPVRE